MYFSTKEIWKKPRQSPPVTSGETPGEIPDPHTFPTTPAVILTAQGPERGLAGSLLRTTEASVNLFAGNTGENKHWLFLSNFYLITNDV